MKSAILFSLLLLSNVALAQEATPVAATYQQAKTQYSNKNYTETIKLLKPLTKAPTATPQLFQLLGQAYTQNEQVKKASAVYEEGIKRFPKQGMLYAARGTNAQKAARYAEALDYYERGIEVEPTLSSNYFHAAQIYLNSDEKVWGLLYGEIFMNLEPNSSRAHEMSKRLYDAYANSIRLKDNKVTGVNLCQNAATTVGKLPQKDKTPFCVVYGTTMTISSANTTAIDLSNLNAIRSNFIAQYQRQGYDQEYNNLLFRYQQQVAAAGHLEAYNHWVLMKGNEPAFGSWLNSHQAEWKAFTNWYHANPLELTTANYFHSSHF